MKLQVAEEELKELQTVSGGELEARSQRVLAMKLAKHEAKIAYFVG